MNLATVIQGGMGVAVSNWRLARAVSSLGQLGVVSGTGIDTVLIRRLQDGDVGGKVRRALAAFPLPDIAKAALQRYFLPDGRPIAAGALLRQPELAATLRRIAAEGRNGFYRGPVAAEIIRAVQPSGNPMTLDDLARFEARWRRPVCGTFMGRTVLTAAPPLSMPMEARICSSLDRPSDSRVNAAASSCAVDGEPVAWTHPHGDWIDWTG